MRLFLLFALLLAAPGASFASTLTFNEFGAAPLIVVNGFHTQGVTFRFASSAFYNQPVGTTGNALLSVDPVLSGPSSGELTLTFDDATPLLQFDILLLSIATIGDASQDLNGGPAYTVLLSNGLSFQGGRPRRSPMDTPRERLRIQEPLSPARRFRFSAVPM